MSDEHLLSLDQLVERTGVPARTVRYYTTRGLLPAPLRQGREVRYHADHLVRLQLVRELQEHGFTLTAIEGYLGRVPDDASPATIDLHRTMIAPWSRTRPTSLSRRELESRAGRPLTDDDLEVLGCLEIVTPGARGRFEVATDRLTTGLALCTLGVPAQAAAAAQAVIAAHGTAVAEELTHVFRTQVWPALRDSGADPERLQDVVEQFGPITVSALVTAYETAMNAAKRDTVARRTHRS